MVHLAALIRRSYAKVYVVLVLVFAFLGSSAVFYGNYNRKQHTISRALESLLAAKEEAAVSYAQFRAGDKFPSAINSKYVIWEDSRSKILDILPDMGITLDAIAKAGRAYFEVLRPAEGTPPNPALVAQSYTALRATMENLVTPLSYFVHRPTPAEVRLGGSLSLSKRYFLFLDRSWPWVLAFSGGFLILILLWASYGLQRSFRKSSNDILDLLWSVLKEQHEPSEFSHFSSEYLQNSVYMLSGENGSLIRRLEELRVALEDFPASEANVPPAPSSEQAAYIQKLLARLFTRAERTAALAKASAGNGAQAGILALNVSIEAARAGDSGRPFLAGAEKIKDFGEKTTRIGEAILEEMKDADSAIRKAYAAGKILLEATPKKESQEQIEPSELRRNALNRADEAISEAMRIQETARTVEKNVEDLIEALKNHEDEPLEDGIPIREAVLRSFELLYYLSRGDRPPTHILKNE